MPRVRLKKVFTWTDGRADLVWRNVGAEYVMTTAQAAAAVETGCAELVSSADVTTAAGRENGHTEDDLPTSKRGFFAKLTDQD